jgi:hypothetical protein
VESDLPWVPLAVKTRLLLDAPFVEALGSTERIYTRAPGSVTEPYVTLQLPTPLGAMGGGGYKPIVQVDAWRVEAGDEDPETVVWRIAMRAMRALETARNVRHQTMHWSARILDAGPLPPDKSRGDDTPLYRAMVRAELTIHNQ